MLDILTAILMTVSGDFLIMPNGLPISRGPNTVFTAVKYTSSALIAGKASITLAGLCYAGDIEVGCKLLELGDETYGLIPSLRASSQIFYGLLLFGTLNTLLFSTATEKSWMSLKSAKQARAFVALNLTLATIAGIISSLIGLMMLYLPMNDGMSSVQDAEYGWGGVLGLGMTLGAGLLAMGFNNEAKEIIERAEGTITLEQDDWDEEVKEEDV